MAGANTKEFTESNFEQEVLSAGEPVLVDFWADWCMPCKALGPIIDELATEYAGKVKVGKVDTDANQNLSARYSISSIPTVLLFQNGQVRQKFVGLRGKKDFQMALNQVLAGA
ncbi:MAG: thioredoxin [Phycisphaerae bacterium]|jgi:thioredoxin 1